MNREDLFYLASGILAVGLWACAVAALWAVVEGGYWLYCKATKREYQRRIITLYLQPVECGNLQLAETNRE